MKETRTEVPVTAPFDTDVLLAYLRVRLLAGVEEIDGTFYRRSIRVGGLPGVMSVDFGSAARRGRVSVSCSTTADVDEGTLTAVVTRLVDGDAPASDINARLLGDNVLGPLARRHNGVRIPGTVDPFELAVRTVLGQQVSVAAARTLAGRIAQRWGTAVGASVPGPSLVFPSAEDLSGARLEEVGVSPSRAHAIRSLASVVTAGRVTLTPRQNFARTEAELLAIPGIGPWTASYISLRGLGDRDAIPLTDLGIRRALGSVSRAEVHARSERWRPWRGYAALLLWSTYLPL